MPKEFLEVKEILAVPKNIVIVPHRNADGDAIGSSLAMYHYLTDKKHRVKVVSPNTYPEFLKWLPASDTVIQYDYQNRQSKRAIDNADVIFLLDFNELSRVGKDMEDYLKNYKGIFIMIDHHQQPSDVARFLYTDTAVCATVSYTHLTLPTICSV